MGLLNKVLGNASKVSAEKLAQKYNFLLTENEEMDLDAIKISFKGPKRKDKEMSKNQKAKRYFIL